MHPDLLYQIALTFVPNVGDIKAKKLIAYCGSAEAVLKSNKSLLQKIPDIGEVVSGSIALSQTLQRAEQELRFVEKNNITALSYLDDDYPYRLKQCEDSPLVLYNKGNALLNSKHIISVVGTRSATQYGKQLCETLMRDFADLNYHPLIVSGLAFGIDIAAHKAALKYGLPTAAVLGHGLNMVYPAVHKGVLENMLFAGGSAISGFASETNMHAANFVNRNRIIAGLADATIVVESAERGGSLITAQMAVDYARDVYAFPARVDDKSSVGCNALIRSNKAGLVTCAADIVYALGWDVVHKKKSQLSVFEQVALSSTEEKIYKLLCEVGAKDIDEICRLSSLPMPEVSSTLLSLEFNGMVKALPGKVFSVVK
ncbi:DNA processing protein DprA [Bacteroidia bacterium]|nr:DNA processing protein DprA [Bacteroidia bacterium]